MDIFCDLREKSKILSAYSWSEISKHTELRDKWIVIDGLVYDVSTWMKKHPGGARIISHFGGQDATDAWMAMHIDKKKVVKYLGPLLVGRVEASADFSDKLYTPKSETITTDFRRLLTSVQDSDLFTPSSMFYVAHLGHIILLELVAYWILAHIGVEWKYCLLAALLLTTAQAQSGWTQHDYGHQSVFSSARLNHLMHWFVIGHLKGTSSHWWNFRHFQHHTKPNVVGKDPDIGFHYLFLLGSKMPVIWGERRKGFAPYNWQQCYFWLIFPPLLLPLYFHVENIYFIYKRKDWVDLCWMLSFFIRFFYCYTPLLGGLGAFAFYMTIRFFESHWFSLVTQMNHIVMEVDRDNPTADWLSSQTAATCNVVPSFFNNWFTGHLNFQIEHHLFPTMPRHNYEKVAPLVKSLCKQHDVPYVEKSLSQAIFDIHRTLRKSGELWAFHYYKTL